MYTVNYDDILKKLGDHLKSMTSFSKPCILLIGDTPLDVYWFYRNSKPMSHQIHTTLSEYQQHFDILEEIRRPGTNYPLASLFRELGFEVYVITCLGDDTIGEYIRSQYEKIGVILLSLTISGASFQRHYMLNEAEVEWAQPQINLTQRINHEPLVNEKKYSKHLVDQQWIDKFQEVIKDCDLILINDTHKGTLSLCSWTPSRPNIQTGMFHSLLFNTLYELNKQVTVLDCRHSIDPYKDWNVKALTSSSYEVALTWKEIRDTLKIPQGGEYTLNESLLRRLFNDYPNFKNWALTCGSKGVQVGINKNKGWSIQSFLLPSLINPKDASGFTAHCGDFFNAGFSLGQYFNFSFVDSVSIGIFLSSLQVQMSHANIIVMKDIVDAINNNDYASSYEVKPEQIIVLKNQRMEEIEDVISYLKTNQPITADICIRNKFIACYPKSATGRELETKILSLKQSHVSQKDIRLSIITGEQGSGKSEFAKALAFMLAVNKTHEEEAVYKWLSQPDMQFDANDYANNDLEFKKYVQKCSSYGVVFLDEFEERHGVWLLAKVNEVLAGGRSDLAQVLQGMDLIIAGSSLLDADTQTHPWKDLSQRARGMIRIPSYDHSIQDLALLFIMLCHWRKDKIKSHAPNEIEIAVLVDVMNLSYSSDNSINPNLQNYYLLQEIFDQIAKEDSWISGKLTWDAYRSALKGKNALFSIPDFAQGSIKLQLAD